jgi:cation:H+ antiporter
MLNYILLLVGFVMLIKGADVFVESASSIAKKFGIPSIVVGLTIVAMGTSAPEFSVSVQSALAGMNDMSIANVVGSNIFNLLVVLGLSSVVNKLKIDNYKDVITMFIVGLIMLICSADGLLNGFDGILLLTVFVGYIFGLIVKAYKEKQKEEIEEKNRPMFITICLGLIGLVAIVWGGDLVVNSASVIAQQLGMSENLIGLTVVALGTSLPELVTSIVATKKGEVDIAIGNVVGSNIFNMLLILGSASVINPMSVSYFAFLDLLFVIGAMFVFIMLTYKDKTLSKAKGIPLVLMYVVYIIFTIIR